MKTILDKATRDELVGRINALTEGSTAQWGKMNVYQMVRHCTLWDEMIQGKRTYKRALLGRIFGKLAMKGALNELPLRRNTPTIPDLKIAGNGDVGAEKVKWAASIEDYAGFTKPEITHVFFGKMTREQVGLLAYKHADHHLRQFGG